MKTESAVYSQRKLIRQNLIKIMIFWKMFQFNENMHIDLVVRSSQKPIRIFKVPACKCEKL